MIWKLLKFVFNSIIGKVPIKDFIDYLINIVPPERRDELLKAMMEGATKGLMKK